MFKKIAILNVYVLAVFAFCTGSVFAEPQVIKLAHMGKPDPVEDVLHAAAVGFKYMLERQSDGELQVKIYPGGSLGKQSDVIEALKNNVIQINIGGSVGFFRVFSPASIFFTPYIFKNEMIAMDVSKGPYGQKLLNAFTEKTGIKGLAYVGAYTWMAITNNKRPIRKLEDLKGLKFRVMDPLGTTMFKSFGATASPIAFTETYTAMQTGVVDGQTNPAFVITSFKFNEVQKYMTLANSQWGYQMIMANKQWHDSLSPKNRLALRDAIQVAIDVTSGLSMIQEIKYIKELEKGGMKIHNLSSKERDRFQAIARPACMKWVRKVMGETWADGLLKAIDESEKKLGYR